MTRDPFDILGLPATFALDADALEARVRELQRAFHPDRHASGTPAERRAALSRAVTVNEAHRVLRDDLSRAAAILRLRGREVKEGGGQADPAFLMEIMELRETLGEARAARAIERVRALAGEVRASLERSKAALADALDARGELERAEAELSKMRYYRRFLDEVELAEEDAASPAP
ncbi:MAG: Fe-S protein assembly co-chaperone HscB [Sandaracinus sp.]